VAIGISPDYAEVHSNLGNALRECKLDEVIAAYRQAIGLNPAYAEAHCNLGTALKEQGNLEDAVPAHRQAISSGRTAGQPTADFDSCRITIGGNVRAWRVGRAY
jgi:tetratricopeptide (TPR) repeat protein